MVFFNFCVVIFGNSSLVYLFLSWVCGCKELRSMHGYVSLYLSVY